MHRFRYLRDALFLLGCSAYVINRWLLKPHLHSGFFHSQFNDLWLIPCALPPILWLHRRLGLRAHDDPPRLSEIAWHLVFWSILFEWIGPQFVPHTTGDLVDVLAYATGAVLAGIWWHRGATARDAFATMSFDVIAPYYRWMEFVLAGEKLQNCRLALLNAVPPASNILLLGEGDGRFLSACRNKFPHARITYVDASMVMIAQTRLRLAKNGLIDSRVIYHHADVLAWTPPANQIYDLIVTNFFLDCFTAQQLDRIVCVVGGVSAKNANWLLADFQVASGRMGQLRSRIILWLMYSFFRATTRLSAHRLIPPDSFLQSAGFGLQRSIQAEWGLLHSDWWQRQE